MLTEHWSLTQTATRYTCTNCIPSMMYMACLIQAYLTRAAQFGREGRLAKAILNCNEAIALKPQSSRAYLYRYLYCCMSVGIAGEETVLTVAILPNSTHPLSPFLSPEES